MPVVSYALYTLTSRMTTVTVWMSLSVSMPRRLCRKLRWVNHVSRSQSPPSAARLRAICRELSRQRANLAVSYSDAPPSLWVRVHWPWLRSPWVRVVHVAGRCEDELLRDFWDLLENPVKRPSYSSPAAPANPVLTTGVLASVPLVLEHLTRRQYDTGEARITSSLLVFHDDETGCLKACLRDRQEGYCCWVAGGTLEDVLLALEGAIESGDPTHWRRDRPVNGGGSAARRKLGGR